MTTKKNPTILPAELTLPQLKENQAQFSEMIRSKVQSFYQKGKISNEQYHSIMDTIALNEKIISNIYKELEGYERFFNGSSQANKQVIDTRKKYECRAIYALRTNLIKNIKIAMSKKADKKLKTNKEITQKLTKEEMSKEITEIDRKISKYVKFLEEKLSHVYEVENSIAYATPTRYKFDIHSYLKAYISDFIQTCFMLTKMLTNHIDSWEDYEKHKRIICDSISCLKEDLTTNLKKHLHGKIHRVPLKELTQ